MITFNAQLSNTQRRIRSISGKLGLFVFRTYKDGSISAYYKQPKHGPLSDQSRVNFGSLSDQLREIATELALSILSINYSYTPDYD